MEIKATKDCEGSETLPHLQANILILLRCFFLALMMITLYGFFKINFIV